MVWWLSSSGCVKYFYKADNQQPKWATCRRTSSPKVSFSDGSEPVSACLPQVHPRPLPGRPEPMAQRRAPSPLPLAADVWECWHHNASPPGSLPEVSAAARPPAEHHDPRKRRPPSAGWVRHCFYLSLKNETRFVKFWQVYGGWQGQTHCKIFSFEETWCSFRNNAIWTTWKIKTNSFNSKQNLQTWNRNTACPVTSSPGLQGVCSVQQPDFPPQRQKLGRSLVTSEGSHSANFTIIREATDECYISASSSLCKNNPKYVKYCNGDFIWSVQPWLLGVDTDDFCRPPSRPEYLQ